MFEFWPDCCFKFRVNLSFSITKYIVCFHEKTQSEVHLSICRRFKKQTLFLGQKSGRIKGVRKFRVNTVAIRIITDNKYFLPYEVQVYLKVSFGDSFSSKKI